MADEKKPKIDLKARLGKTTAAPGGAPAAAPPPAAPPVSPSGRPMPMPVPSPSQPPQAVQSAPPPAGPAALPIPAPMPSAGVSMGLPVPAGYAAPGGLAAAMAPPPAPAQRAPAPPPEPQRIEIDELTIQQAAKASLKKGVMIGCILAVMAGGVGYVAGGAQQQATDRTKSKEGAVDLATNATKAKEQLKLLADKMEAGKKSLITDKKFPDSLARDLGAINVDFDGKQLEGRRFSGYSLDTTRALVEFITAVQGVNDRKLLIQGLLTKLEKPITEQLKIKDGEVRVNYVVGIDHDGSGNVAALLGKLVEPINATGGTINLPPEFTFSNGSSNTKLPAFKSGDIGQKPAAIYVVPSSFDRACPSATGGQIAQLGAQIGTFIADLKGEAPDANTVSDSKPGLLERADKLIKALGTVGG